MDIKIINKIFPIIENNENLQYDSIGIFSITLPSDANEISKIILENDGSDIEIFDGTAGLGGNTISFAYNFRDVIGCEIDKNRFKMLENNINTYNLNNVSLYNDNSINLLNKNNKSDVYFFDPPWGGPDYKHHNTVNIRLGNLSIYDIILKIRDYTDSPIYFKLPNNYDINELFDFNYDINIVKNYKLISIL